MGPSPLYRYRRWVVAVGVVLGLAGCSHPTPPTGRPVFIQLKSPHYRLSEAGFLKIAPNYKELTLSTGFNSYRFLLRGEEVCQLEGGKERCIPRRQFLERLGFGEYPPETLDQILTGEPLPFLSTPISTPDGGFLQRGEGVVYRVTPTKILFKDSSHQLLLVLRFQTPNPKPDSN